MAAKGPPMAAKGLPRGRRGPPPGPPHGRRQRRLKTPSTTGPGRFGGRFGAIWGRASGALWKNLRLCDLRMFRFGSAELSTSALGVKRVRRSGFPLVPRPSEAKKGSHQPKFQTLQPITNGSKMSPITMDFDDTRWDLIPPMRLRSSGGLRVKKRKFEIYF